MLVKLVRFAFYQHAEGTVMSLTDTKVKNARPAEKAVKLTDGFGLYLLVHPNGSKYWQLGYRFDGKQKVFSIGVYPAVSLADARQRRDEAKKLLAQGIDPNAKKQADEKALQEKRDKTRSFRVVARSILTLKNRLMKKLCRKSGIKPVRSVSSPEAGLPPKQNGLKITPIRYGSALRPMYSRILVTATFQIWIRVICLFR